MRLFGGNYFSLKQVTQLLSEILEFEGYIEGEGGGSETIALFGFATAANKLAAKVIMYPLKNVWYTRSTA